MWWVQTTTGSAVALGTLAMVQTLVGVTTGPFAGALIDRWDRKAIIVGTDILRGMNYLVLAWLVYAGQLTMPILYGITALNALCGQFFGPAISASTRHSVHGGGSFQYLRQRIFLHPGATGYAPTIYG